MTHAFQLFVINVYSIISLFTSAYALFIIGAQPNFKSYMVTVMQTLFTSLDVYQFQFL